MYRILHISDLHLTLSAFTLEDLLDPFGKTGLDVVARLRIQCEQLRPNAIIVTGDLTDLGDRDSFQHGRELLEAMKKACGAELVLCIPGNHDLYDNRFFFKLIPRPFWNHMTNYRESIKEDYGVLSPQRPTPVETVWGKIAFFLFNSCDPKLRDQGRISDDQQVQLTRYLTKVEDDDAIRVALVHHHPLSAPSLDLNLKQQLIQMRDGTKFIENLKTTGFHLVLHGHQHVPFYSASSIQTSPRTGSESRLHVLAAGSALRHGDHPPSFNVIDVLSPFTAEMRRYDYDKAAYSGFQEVDKERRLLQLFDASLRLESLSRRPSDTSTVNPRNAAATNLRCVERKGIDRDHQYDRIEYKVTIQQAGTDYYYLGEYRRTGQVEVEQPKGWFFVLTGEPAVSIADLGLQLTDGKGDQLGVEAAKDKRRRHVIRAFRTISLGRGEPFDVTMKFRWPTASYDPNDYDGFNLLYFQHQVGLVCYEVTLPWKPGELRVWSCGARVREERVEWRQSGQTYSFEIERPLHAPYLVQIGEKSL